MENPASWNEVERVIGSAFDEDPASDGYDGFSRRGNNLPLAHRVFKILRVNGFLVDGCLPRETCWRSHERHVNNIVEAAIEDELESFRSLRKGGKTVYGASVVRKIYQRVKKEGFLKPEYTK